MKRPGQIIMHGAAVLGFVVWGSASAGKMQDMPCTEEIRKYCADVQPGGGRILQCLKDNESKLSPACMHRMNDLRETISGPLGACREDWVALCYHPRAATDRQAMIQCLQANEAKVSPGCKKALQGLSGTQRQRSRTMTP